MSRDLEDLVEEVAGRGERPTRSGPAESEVGSARHLTVAEMEERSWTTDRRHTWAVDAEAWPPVGEQDFVRRYPGQAAGAPAYYPKGGVGSHQLEYTWGPTPSEDGRAWLELSFAEGLPPAQAVRIFEMQGAGSVVAVEGVQPDGTRETLWRGPAVDDAPEPDVLEVDVSPPRRLSRVRVYVATGQAAKSPVDPRVDAVALVATEPVTDQADATKGRYTRWYAKLAALVLVLLALALGVVWLTYSQQEAEPTAPAPAVIADGDDTGRMRTTRAALAEMDVVWASEAVGASSQYATEGWEPSQATGAPDLWPRLADDRRAWAPEDADAGEEWLEVRFPEPTEASSVLIVESFHPGAVVRVEAGPEREVLWQGKATPVGDEDPSILRVDLPDAKVVDTLRIVLDTAAVEGWNEIDAVGVVPVR